MSARILDGRACAAAVKAELAVRVDHLKARGTTPGLGTVLVGSDPASQTYVAGKHRDCAEVGITSLREDLPAEATQADVEAAIDRLNADPACTAYLVQLPMPGQIDAQAVLERVDPAKDADGLHPLNLGRLVLSPWRELSSPLPCTPRGIVALLAHHGVPLAGSHVAVVGRGITVGRPIGLLLSRKLIDSTVTLCHTGTRNLAAMTRTADVVVAATGFPGLIGPEMVAPGAAVLDVGITRILDAATGTGRLVGDVDPRVGEVAGWISPNPGGVGPMTRAMLLVNVVEAAERAVGVR